MISLKKSVRIFIGLNVLFIVLSCIFAYIMSYSFSKRIKYSSDRVQEHIKNRSILEKQFNARTVTFFTSDNVKLSGLLVIRPQAKRVWLLCHGYRMAKERLLPFVELFSDDSIFMFDYRAHGESEGTHTTFGFHERTDVRAAVDFLKQHAETKNLPLYGLGVSMGAVSLLGAAVNNNDFKALILDSPFAQLSKQVERIITTRYHLPDFFFVRMGKYIFEKKLRIPLSDVNTVAWGVHLKTPGLFIYSLNDAVALASDVQAIYETVSCQKEQWCIQDCQHARIIVNYPEDYKKQVYAFLEKLQTRPA